MTPAATPQAPPIKVLVTRPEPDAGRWVAQLRALGFDAKAVPLIVIAPVANRLALQQAWRTAPRFHAIMCVSAAAATHFLAARPAHIDLDSADFPKFWAPGPGTARALLAGGVSADRIQSPPGDAVQFDSEALWSVVEQDVSSGDQILIVRGEDAKRLDIRIASNTSETDPVTNPGHGRGWMARTLATRGAVANFVVVYRREAPQWSAAEKAATLKEASGAIWLFSNSDAIATLVRLLGPDAWVPAAALCTHPRIAEAARSAGFAPLQESRPTIESITTALRELAAEVHSS